MPYLLEKSRFGINFFAKRNTILLLYVYQVFIFLQDHLYFFLHFFFTLMEQLFLDDPIFSQKEKQKQAIKAKRAENITLTRDMKSAHARRTCGCRE